MNKLQIQARKAKSAGFTHVASVVKSVFRTTYYHVVDIDDVINSGKWPAAPVVTFASGARGRAGVMALPANTLLRSRLYSL